jgi:predicted nucleotidyltransferase
VQKKPELRRAGYFGSYARGDWGVGSDLDLIVIVEESQLDFFHRSIEWDTSGIPVPVDLLVYTEDEWHGMADRQERFYKTIESETIWIYPKRESPTPS